MATTTADVPSRFDLVLSGGSLANPVGFVFLDALEPSLPFRTHRAIYSYTPTFIERQNVSGNFGDNQQDFFLTSSQRDWSEGEQQRFYRQTDQDSVRRYWKGTAVDVRVPGQVAQNYSTSSLSFAANAATVGPAAKLLPGTVSMLTSTKFYSINSSGTITDKGAHGLGATPSTFGFAIDGNKSYFSTTSGGGVGVRSYDGNVTFATFSAAQVDALAFLNNTLYGMTNTSGTLYRFDTAGTATSLFTWSDASGGGRTNNSCQLIPYGGKLLILIVPVTGRSELWTYDGNGVSMLAQFTPGFVANQMTESQGVVYISGTLKDRPAIHFYANGTLGELWEGAVPGGTVIAPALTGFNGGLLFTDSQNSVFRFYNTASGGVSSVGTYTASGSTPLMAADPTGSGFVVHTQASSTGYLWPTSTVATSSTVTTSLFDFDSSLTKSMRGITVDFDSATTGNGGTVDIAYRTGDVDGSYTSLQTGATSGTEYTISGVTGRSISVQVTLNKGTSTLGPVLKRVYVRGAPILTTFRNCEYILDCTGDAGRSPRTLRDGTPNPLSGDDSMDQLEIAKSSTTPLTITDRRGSYTGFLETVEGYEEHPGIDDPTRSGEFVVKVTTRGI